MVSSPSAIDPDRMGRVEATGGCGSCCRKSSAAGGGRPSDRPDSQPAVHVDSISTIMSRRRSPVERVQSHQPTAGARAAAAADEELSTMMMNREMLTNEHYRPVSTVKR